MIDYKASKRMMKSQEQIQADQIGARMKLQEIEELVDGFLENRPLIINDPSDIVDKVKHLIKVATVGLKLAGGKEK